MVSRWRLCYFRIVSNAPTPTKVYQIVWVAGPAGFAILLPAEEEPAKGRGAAYGCQYRSDYLAVMAGLTFVVFDPLSP